MPGLRFVQTFGLAPTAAPTYCWIALPIGARLRFVGARNHTKGSTRVSILLRSMVDIDVSTPIVTQGTKPVNVLPLMGPTTQGSIGDWIFWYGDVILSEDTRVVIGSFADPDASDQIRIVAGVE